MTRHPKLVLVTGATGFLGSHIVDSYVRRGIPVRAMARKTSLRTWLQPHLEAGLATLTEGTMTDQASLTRAVEGVSHIVHAAALIGPNVSDREYEAVNVEGTRVLLEASVKARVWRFTLISAFSTYGYGVTPGGIVTEETPQMPAIAYGKSKLAQQKLLFEAYEKEGLPGVSIEPPVIYGPRARGGIAPMFKVVKKRFVPMLDYGRERANIVHVADVVSLLEAADASERAVGERFLAVGPRFVTHKEIAQIIARSLGVRPLYMPIPLWLTVVGLVIHNAFLGLRGKDILLRPTYFYRTSGGADYRSDKAGHLLGWQPQIDVKTGLPETVAWFVAHESTS